MVGRCLLCGVEIRLGGLCREHADGIATCNDLTAEQIQCRAPDTARAHLVDQWGCLHGLSDVNTIGRAPTECSLAILHHSISARHAQIERSAEGWRLIDRGSLNGTSINGARVRESRLEDGARVGFGDVSLWFTSQVHAALSAALPPGRTVPTRARDIAFSATFMNSSNEIELHQRASGGIARTTDASSFEFARLEFALLIALAQRKLESRDPELAFVSSTELAEKLEFKSRDADSENVRELVRRVRRKLKAEGIEDLIESRQGVGYRLAWAVKPPIAP